VSKFKKLSSTPIWFCQYICWNMFIQGFSYNRRHSLQKRVNSRWNIGFHFQPIMPCFYPFFLKSPYSKIMFACARSLLNWILFAIIINMFFVFFPFKDNVHSTRKRTAIVTISFFIALFCFSFPLLHCKSSRLQSCQKMVTLTRKSLSSIGS